MPFMGKDWRSPGEAWVKTESLGWQRMKLIETQLHSSACRSTSLGCSSWPPGGEYVEQHMEQQRCVADQQRTSGESVRLPKTSDDIQCHEGSCGSSRSSTSFDSNCNRAGSASPSMNNTPEKTSDNLPSVIMSSPYGQYSCCAHHFESAPGSPKSTRLMHSDKTLPQSITTRSLSRESLNSSNMVRSDGTDTATSSNSSFLEPAGRLELNTSEYRSGSQASCAPNEDDRIGRGIDDKQKSTDDGVDLTGQCILNPTETSSCCSLSINRVGAEDSLQCCFYCQQNKHQSCQTRSSFTKTAPHCRISVRTREVAMYNTISEAFYRLDFCNAIHDIRRFNYICKLLHLLITQNLTSLSGCATKVLFTMLEQVAWEVSSNKRNIHVLRDLLDELKSMLQRYYCWGRPIGSSLLWQQHFDTIQRIGLIISGIELAPPNDETGRSVTFSSLPVEMVREILLRLNDYRDLINSAGASPVMRTMINEQHLWKKLCRYHFTIDQIKLALGSYNSGGKPVKQESRNSRGIKYARTTSADGRVSYRNPTAHEQQQQKALNKPTSDGKKTDNETTRDLKQNGTRSKDSSSHVTRTIRKFDKDRYPFSQSTSDELRAANTTATSTSTGHRRSRQKTSPVQSPSTSQQQLASGKQVEREAKGRVEREVDWERIFHHLRKKFDLKEEYADCLLLCRHCRCLFWKSFGHPCIKGDDNQIGTDEHKPEFRLCDRRVSNNNLAASQNGSKSGGLQAPSRRQPLRQSHQNEQDQRRTSVVGLHEDRIRSRLSVAALSRSFDNRNLALSNDPARSASRQGVGQENLLSSQAQRSDNVAQRSHNNQPPPIAARRVEAAANDIPNRVRTRDRINELVPKHVAISPQAFLKFFSL